MKNILYIGRFQPFHAGHADAIVQIFEKFSGEDIRLFIGIGSAEENFTEKNPLTAGERFEIIDAALQEMNISREKYSILPIRNINHYALWPHHVQQFFPPIDVLASGSPLVQSLWKNSFPHSEIFSLEQRIKTSASSIRKNIFSEQRSSNKYLLSSTQSSLEEFCFSSRLQNMSTAIEKS